MTEATLSNTVSNEENERYIQDMLRTAKPEELEGELTRNPVISRGTDGDAPVPSVVASITSAGYVFIWDTRTGRKVPVLYYMLSKKLRQRREDGSFRFTTSDPRIAPVHNMYKCFLHPEDPNRADYDKLGFRVCPKSNILNEFQRIRHMATKHKEEWKTIEDARVRREREEDRTLQRLVLQQLGDKTADAKRAKYVCDICGLDFGSIKMYTEHMETHKRSKT